MADLVHPDILVEAALGVETAYADIGLGNMTKGTGASDPDGGSNAYTIRETTANGYHWIRFPIAGAWLTGDEGHIHFFVQQQGTDKDLQIGFYGTTGSAKAYCRFDFSAGTFTVESGCKAEAESVGGSPLWYEIDVRTTSGDMEDLAYIYLHHNLAAVYTGVVTDGFNLYQAIPDSMVDLTDALELEEAIISSGRSNEWDRMLASTMDLTLFDGDEELNFENPNSTYAGGLHALAPIRLTAIHDFGPVPIPTTLTGRWGGQYVTPTYGAPRPPGFSDTYATALFETTDTGYHYVRWSVPIALASSGVGDVYHWRCAVKQVGADKDIRMYFDATTNYYATFDFSAGAFSAASSGINTKVTSLGSSWYMLEMWNDPDVDISGLTYVNLYLNAAASYAGNTSDGIHIYIPQGKDEGYSVWCQHRLFQGYIQKIECGSWLSAEEDYRSSLSCVDEFTKLALLPANYAGTTSISDPFGFIFGTRLGYASFKYDFPTLGFTVNVPTEDGSRTVADVVSQALNELGGIFYIRHADGKIVWEDYTDVYGTETAPRDAYQSAIDDQMAGCKLIRDAATIYNQLTTGGGTNTKLLSQQMFGIRELAISSADFVDAYGGDGAYNQYTHSQLGRTRAKVTLDGSSIDILHAQLQRFLYDRVRIREAPSVNTDYGIESVEHSIVGLGTITTKWEAIRWSPW